MKTLYLLRHGDALSCAEGSTDHDRKLSPKGRSQAAFIGERLSSRAQALDLILSSDALRARQTAEIVRAAFPSPPELRCLEGLYHASLPFIQGLIADLEPGEGGKGPLRVLVVGHNPVMEEMASRLSGTLKGMGTCDLYELCFSGDDWREAAMGRGLSSCAKMSPRS